jgi:GT2 family glycosyltransferase/glycosyltransferase involved in cell wall biosynthesis
MLLRDKREIQRQHIRALETELEAGEQIIDHLQNQLNKLKSEEAQLVRQQLEEKRWYQRLLRICLIVKKFFMLKEQVFSLKVQGQKVLREEGFRVFMVKAIQSMYMLVKVGVLTSFDAVLVIRHFGIRKFLSTIEADKAKNLDPEVEPETLLRSDVQSYDVIIFPIIEWEFRFQRPQQIAVQFAKAGHRVFYLCTTFHGKKKSSIRVIQDRIYEVHLPGPQHLNVYIDSIGEQIEDRICDSFVLLRREFGIVDAVCLVNLPFWRPVAFKLREKFGWQVVYDCMDHHAGFSTNKEEMLREERALILGSDLVLASSRLIFQEQSLLNKNCVLIPNAADFEHFHYSARENPPQEIRDIKKPIIGYYGAISDWFDSELVRALAQERPGWSFVLIGSTFGSRIDHLNGEKNIHLFGEKPYAVLPSYLSAFDVCIIPFKKTPLTEATNPVKIFEFLSAGKAVVATELAELQHFNDYVHLASEKDGWLQAIEDALKDDDPVRIQARFDFARQNTWDKRALQIEELIRSLYTKVSIIVITYDNLDLTKMCIDSIIAKTHYPNFEIIIVDNNSQDGTKEYLLGLAADNSNMKIILNENNEGFAKANNKGIMASSGDYIVFLNNDTIVTRGWLTRLLRHLQDERVGMVGPVTNFCGNEAKIDVLYRSVKELEEFSEQYIREHMEPKGYDIKVLAMYCLAMRKSVVDEIGLLDEQFEIGMFEDDDYSHRVRLKGYRVVYAEDIFIHHFGEASFGKLKKSGKYMKLFEENKKRFEEKWGIKWEPHRHRS